MNTRLIGFVGLLVAVLAAGRLLTLPQPEATPVAAAPAASVRDVWPSATIVRSPGRLPDGRAYTPWFHRDAETSVGTALTGDGAFLRLVVRTPRAVRELLRLPTDGNPQFNGFATSGDDIVFMASSDSVTTLYRAAWGAGTASVLTTDAGTVVFFNSQYDIVIADGAAHWAAVDAPGTASGTGHVTEVRSVPLTGGRVAVRTVEGAFAMAAWPWLTSAGSGSDGAVRLQNLRTGETISVPGARDELITCGAVWCRVLVIGPGGQPAATELMRPSGTDRRRVAAGGTTSAVLDVALLDRFEVLTRTTTGAGSTSLTLILHDLTTDRSVPLAGGAATVHARGPVLWWSTGSAVAVEWFALDLRTLT